MALSVMYDTENSLNNNKLCLMISGFHYFTNWFAFKRDTYCYYIIKLSKLFNDFIIKTYFS